MEKQLLNKISTLTSTLFEDFIAVYQVCDKDETDEYFKHFIILIFKDRKPYTIYGTKDKELIELFDDITFLYRCSKEKKENE